MCISNLYDIQWYAVPQMASGYTANPRTVSFPFGRMFAWYMDNYGYTHILFMDFTLLNLGNYVYSASERPLNISDYVLVVPETKINIFHLNVVTFIAQVCRGREHNRMFPLKSKFQYLC